MQKTNNHRNSNYNNGNRQPRQKVTPVIASAIYLSFEEAIQALRSAHSVIDNYFSDIDIDAGYDEYVAYVSAKAAEAAPQLLAKRNIHVQYSISGTNVFVRTEDQLAFGWTVTYKVEDGHASISSVKVTITMFDTFEDLKDYLAAQAWTLEERRSRRESASTSTDNN